MERINGASLYEGGQKYKLESWRYLACGKLDTEKTGHIEEVGFLFPFIKLHFSLSACPVSPSLCPVFHALNLAQYATLLQFIKAAIKLLQKTSAIVKIDIYEKSPHTSGQRAISKHKQTELGITKYTRDPLSICPRRRGGERRLYLFRLS